VLERSISAAIISGKTAQPGRGFRGLLKPSEAASEGSQSWQDVLRFVFSPLFIFNNMARFVFRFVFSTGTYFQQLLRFVFRFVPVCFLAISVCFQQRPRFVFKKRYSFLFFKPRNRRKMTSFVPPRSLFNALGFAILGGREPQSGRLTYKRRLQALQVRLSH
jgi:hypothetical protein